MPDNTAKLKKIKNAVIACQKCGLCKTRTNPVIGEGNHQAKILFVGEAPGAEEDRQAKPFCGRSGQFLTELVESIGLKRADVYICNLLKCRPPGNRDPQPDEITICTQYLKKQIEIIKPQIVCSLGRYSMQFLMEKLGLGSQLKSISQIHGQIFTTKEWIANIKFIPFFHPAVAVYNSDMKEALLNDFRLLKKI
ncbi:MAG: uracil-DNA glycosylase [Candidatus Portnoybacteria bacterium CG10_big_fil_rev_8_21_14_0_10_44_7]|uniref:Type-4 uracil-DNA glycosylase n=1 Tax=Candidatus Portnoybacteria bacterium CG10_big_fil_rev_8_21_14_0_10_44_7 TaxID=1974816 RepID=A0A2M8KI88_9BACT|nr:MAG: uracil-DNA glycosylase [Candidatus Portnoybacteria bacterium CG10_big_fil_rev_8_21_14_0_10_44_7]